MRPPDLQVLSGCLWHIFIVYQSKIGGQTREKTFPIERLPHGQNLANTNYAYPAKRIRGIIVLFWIIGFHSDHVTIGCYRIVRSVHVLFDTEPPWISVQVDGGRHFPGSASF